MLLPHFGHSILTVGKVRSFCSSFPIIAMDSWGERSMALTETGDLSPAYFLKPHFGHTRLKTGFFAFLSRRETRRIPHFGQNSISLTTISAQIPLQLTLLNLFTLTG